MDKLVTIITPMYNSQEYIGETIQSVQAQTYKNFEMIIVDDMSTDESIKIVQKYSNEDSRIRLYSLNEKKGAAGARNFATKKSKGEIIAFLDADDVWNFNKLELMIKFMNDNNYVFVYSDYKFMDQYGSDNGIMKVSPNKLTYFKLLCNSSSIGCLTALYDVKVVGKIYVPLLKKRNDVAIWQRILKDGHVGFRFPKVLATHRLVPNSLSRRSGKISLFKHHYTLYRTNLNKGPFLSVFFSLVNVFFYFYTKIFRIRTTVL